MYKVVSLSGGKDSTAMLLMMLERNVPFDEVVFFDTGWEFPQMYEHLDKLESDTGVPITRLHDDVGLTERMLHNHRTRGKRANIEAGFGWPTPLYRWCTTCKTQIINKYLRQHGEHICYVGIAADEPKRVKDQLYPLVEWGVTEADALAYCYERGYDWGGAVRPLQARVVLLLPVAVYRRTAAAPKAPSRRMGADARLGLPDKQAAGQAAGQVQEGLRPPGARDAVQARRPPDALGTCLMAADGTLCLNACAL